VRRIREPAGSLAVGAVFAVLSVCRVMITLCLESVIEMRGG